MPETYPGPPMYVVTFSAGLRLPMTQTQWDDLRIDVREQLLGQGRVQMTGTPGYEEYANRR